ncbi:MAG: HAD-IA family hydrolase [Candidatus Moranbacteria bacterium]|nr:HAD-IA family hydrolase [Candidatus Moranbacteria bacterium]NTW45806.1 HAD-IA family hydrolase [Candidatus Moranbacteria bacterium]
MNDIKAILLDADGLLIKKQRYFSDILHEQYGVSAEMVIPFFKTRFRDCQKATADLKEELVPFLKQWKWEGDVESFLEFWFSQSVVDSDVLDVVRDLRERGLKCYLATDQEKYRAEYIEKNLGIGHELDGFFYSFESGLSKSDPRFFEVILEKLDLSPEEVIFFDDEEENVEVGRSFGIKSVLIDGTEDFRSVAERYVKAI